MLYSSDAEESTPTPKRGAVSQRALSFLVLFDSVLLHDFSNGIFRIPDIEGEGILQVITRGQPARAVEPLRTRWRLGPLRNRRRPPASLPRSLRLFKEERVLIIDRLLSVRSYWERSLAAALGISRRDFLNAFFDYALACVEGDQRAGTRPRTPPRGPSWCSTATLSRRVLKGSTICSGSMSLPPFPSRTMSWWRSKSTSLTRSGALHEAQSRAVQEARHHPSDPVQARQDRSGLLACEHNR